MGKRYLRGNVVNRRTLEDALASGYQRQRSAAALELGLLEPNAPLFEVRARGRIQMERLSV